MNIDIDKVLDAIKIASAYSTEIMDKYEDEQVFQALLLIARGTRYQIARDMKHQGDCIGCMTAEGDFLTSSLLKKDSDKELFLKSHTQEEYSDRNGRDPIVLKQPAFPMINLVTPKVGTQVYQRDIEQGIEGISPRFVPFFHTTPDVMPEQACDESALHEYESIIRTMLSTYYTQKADERRHEVIVEKEAVQLLLNFKKENIVTASSMPELAGPYMRKAHGQAARFAWDIHAVNHNGQSPHEHPITVQEVEQGINLVKATFSHIRYIYDPCGFVALHMAKEIVRSLLRITGPDRLRVRAEGIDSTTLQQRIRATFPGKKSSQINNALRLLERHNALSIYDSGTNNLKVVLHTHFFRINWNDYGVRDC